MFLCRTLSYKGAEFDVVEAPLDAKMTVYENTISFFKVACVRHANKMSSNWFSFISTMRR